MRRSYTVIQVNEDMSSILSDGLQSQACLLPQKVGPQPVENEDLSDIIGDILDEIPLPDIDIGGDTEIA